MSNDKYPSIFLPQMEAIVFIILQIFLAKHAVLKIGEQPIVFLPYSNFDNMQLNTKTTYRETVTTPTQR